MKPSEKIELRAAEIYEENNIPGIGMTMNMARIASIYEYLDEQAEKKNDPNI